MIRIIQNNNFSKVLKIIKKAKVNKNKLNKNYQIPNNLIPLLDQKMNNNLNKINKILINNKL